MINVLSMDLEDWYQLAHRRVSGELLPARDTVFRQLHSFLQLLDEAGARATFFTVGMLAEQYPQVVRELVQAGHEVACHGYRHLLVHRLAPEEFRADTDRARKLLEDLSGKRVTGYRAAEFSIRANSLWALDVLAELGFEYDSSIFPIRHRRYGIAGFDRRPRAYDLRDGRRIVELPPSTLQAGNARVPVAGGGYFRLLPLAVLISSVERLSREGLPLITYLHPYEFDEQRLDLFATFRGGTPRQRLRARLFNFHQNLRRTTMRSKLAALLRRFRFTTCREFVDATSVVEGRKLFSAHGG